MSHRLCLLQLQSLRYLAVWEEAKVEEAIPALRGRASVMPHLRTLHPVGHACVWSEPTS